MMSKIEINGINYWYEGKNLDKNEKDAILLIHGYGGNRTRLQVLWDYFGKKDEIRIRTQAIANRIPLISTVTAATAFVNGIEALKKSGVSVRPLQDYGQRYEAPAMRTPDSR